MAAWPWPVTVTTPCSVRILTQQPSRTVWYQALDRAENYKYQNRAVALKRKIKIWLLSQLERPLFQLIWMESQRLAGEKQRYTLHCAESTTGTSRGGGRGRGTRRCSRSQIPPSTPFSLGVNSEPQKAEWLGVATGRPWGFQEEEAGPWKAGRNSGGSSCAGIRLRFHQTG